MHDERIARLVGNGKNDASGGGGILLPDAFRAVLKHLLDNGMSSIGDICRVVADELAFKENRVIAVWGSWEALTQDLLDQLAFRHLVVSGAMPFTNELWELAEGFKPHPYRHTVIGENEIPGVQRLRISVESSASEHTRNRLSKIVLDLNSVKAGLERDGLLTRSMDAAFIRLIAVMSATAEPAEPPPPKRKTGRSELYGQIGLDYEPEDDPSRERACKKCGNKYPWTRQYWQVYKDATRGRSGRWYWRPECNTCRAQFVQDRDERWMTEIVSIISELEDEEINLPTVTRLMSDTNDQRRVMNLWNKAAARGLVPPCPKKPRNRPRGGLPGADPAGT